MPDDETPPGTPGPGPATVAILERPVEDEMRAAYIDYAMSVIVGRALPDARDGLKPVHRRILYGMYDMGLDPNKAPKKSARVVGDVLGKYHPHGDMAVYDALVRLAQPFSLRYPLIDGQGNFGSVDGDGAAAMRYTECRLAPMARELLEDIDRETVAFSDNFDASMKEPTVLPARLPNLLVNGSSGIAVGMATNMAPHNLGEVVDAVVLQLEDPAVALEDLMRVLPGPDFPTGGILRGRRGILEAYATGRGIVRVRGRAAIEDHGGKERILITEIPYQVNKSKLLEDAAALVRDKKLEGISDLRDESDRNGMRIVVELKRGAIAEVVLNNLYKHTALESSFGILNLALVDNEPKVLPVKDLIQVYIDHRLEVVRLRTEFLLRKARDRAHIVEGLLIALDSIDAVIELIRASADTATAQAGLVATFSLSEPQAKAILDMRLSTLTSLKTQELRDELAQLRKDIAMYERILADEGERRSIIKTELLELKTRFGDARRTTLEATEGEDLVIEDLIQDDSVVVMLTSAGYVKRVPLGAYRVQGRGGKGLIGMRTKEEDHVVDLFVCTNHQDILFITHDGVVHAVKAYRVPEGDRYAKGAPVVSLFERLEPGTRIQAAIPVREFREDQYLFFATRQGKVKKTPLTEYEQINVNGKIATRLEDGDELVGVAITGGHDDVILVKNSGKGVRFHEDQVRPMGRVAAGVRGTECREGEHVVSMVVVRDPQAALLSVTARGKGKRTPFASFNPKNRGAWGVFMHECDDETGPVIGAVEVAEGDGVLFTSKHGIIIRTPAADIRLIGSGQAKGVIVQQLEAGDETVAVARLAPEDHEPEAPVPGSPPGPPGPTDEGEMGPKAGSSGSEEDGSGGAGEDEVPYG